jgi:Tfp pilus assembly protein PilX
MRNRRGTILVVALVTLLVVTLLAGAVLRGYLQAHRQLRREQDQLQAQWLADSALARAVAQLHSNPKYAGETWKVEVASSTADATPGTVGISVAADPEKPDSVRIAIEATFPADDLHRTLAQRTLIVAKPPPTDN